MATRLRSEIAAPEVALAPGAQPSGSGPAAKPVSNVAGADCGTVTSPAATVVTRPAGSVVTVSDPFVVAEAQWVRDLAVATADKYDEQVALINELRSDLIQAEALVNECKAQINGLMAALRAAGMMKT